MCSIGFVVSQNVSTDGAQQWSSGKYYTLWTLHEPLPAWSVSSLPATLTLSSFNCFYQMFEKQRIYPGEQCHAYGTSGLL